MRVQIVDFVVAIHYISFISGTHFVVIADFDSKVVYSFYRNGISIFAVTSGVVVIRIFKIISEMYNISGIGIDYRAVCCI